jgi:hypothetical protein
VGVRPTAEQALYAKAEPDPARRLRRVRWIVQTGAVHKRQASWAEDKPDGRWRSFEYDELLKRDKLSLDLFWIKDQSVEDSSTLPDPEELGQEIVDDLEDALEQFTAIEGALKAKV